MAWRRFAACANSNTMLNPSFTKTFVSLSLQRLITTSVSFTRSRLALMAICSKVLRHVGQQHGGVIHRATTAGSLQNMPPYEALTERELEVLNLLAQGMPNKEIAAQLIISERTAKFHVSSIMGKLGATNRTEAVSLAAQKGLITLHS